MAGWASCATGVEGASARMAGSLTPDPPSEDEADDCCSSTTESWSDKGNLLGEAAAEAPRWVSVVGVSAGVFPAEAAGVGGDVTRRGEDGDEGR